MEDKRRKEKFKEDERRKKEAFLNRFGGGAKPAPQETIQETPPPQVSETAAVSPVADTATEEGVVPPEQSPGMSRSFVGLPYPTKEISNTSAASSVLTNAAPSIISSTTVDNPVPTGSNSADADMKAILGDMEAKQADMEAVLAGRAFDKEALTKKNI
jgi:hypothetical protein